MPLERSSSKPAFKRNVSTLMHEVGKSPHVKSREQALAIAYSIKRRNRAMGGNIMPPTQPPVPAMNAMGVAPTQPVGMPLPVPPATTAIPPMVAGMQPQQFNRGGTPNLAFGGLGIVKSPSMTPTWQERQEARNLTRGPILSAVPGRTDAHATHVPSGSYVIPADIVSGRGQGNTLAGAQSLQKLFKMGPYASGMPALMRGHGIPHAVKPLLRSGGGKDGHHVGKPVRVNLAGGEIVVPPENLMHVVHPNLKHAHAIMDAWVLHERKKLRKTLAKLPGPVKE